MAAYGSYASCAKKVQKAGNSNKYDGGDGGNLEKLRGGVRSYLRYDDDAWRWPFLRSKKGGASINDTQKAPRGQPDSAKERQQFDVENDIGAIKGMSAPGGNRGLPNRRAAFLCQLKIRRSAPIGTILKRRHTDLHSWYVSRREAPRRAIWGDVKTRPYRIQCETRSGDAARTLSVRCFAGNFYPPERI